MDVRKRWDTVEGRRLLRDARTWLMKGGTRPDGLREHDGRVDLRGAALWATPATVGEPGNADGPRWEGIDFTGAQMDEARLFGVAVRDCVLDRVGATGWRCWGVHVSHSSFIAARLRSASLGGGEWLGRASVWDDVDFSRGTMRGANFNGARVVNCSFSGLKDVHFVDCPEVSGHWRGAVEEVIVQGVRMPTPGRFAVSMADAVVSDLTITGMRVDRAVLGITEPRFLIVPAVGESLARVAPNPAYDRALGMVRHLTQHAPEGSDAVFDVESLPDDQWRQEMRSLEAVLSQRQ